MKRKNYIVIAALAAAYMLSACGNGEEVHVIEKESEMDASVGDASEGGDTETGSQTEANAGQGQGYCFVYNNAEIYVNEDMSEVLSDIGEANSYYEAASCAFENEVDKTYMYSGFQIVTYPTDGNDYVYYILLQDDTVETSEKIRIGSSLDDVILKYGTEYTEDGNMMEYEMDGMQLCFIIEDEKVTSIQYLSTVLD